MGNQYVSGRCYPPLVARMKQQWWQESAVSFHLVSALVFNGQLLSMPVKVSQCHFVLTTSGADQILVVKPSNMPSMSCIKQSNTNHLPVQYVHCVCLHGQHTEMLNSQVKFTPTLKKKWMENDKKLIVRWCIYIYIEILEIHPQLYLSNKSLSLSGQETC